MIKPVHVTGYIELPSAAELPPVGSIVHVGSFKAEVTGKHEDKQQRRGDVVEMVYTAQTAQLEGARITKTEAPDPGMFAEGDDAAPVDGPEPAEG